MRFASTLAALALASSLVGCADSAHEDIELPETITDGAADSWGHPTQYGTLFQGTWQFGALDPGRNMSFPAWSFFLGGPAQVSVITRAAPTAAPALTSTVLYVYKQRDAGTWERIARTEPGDSFARISQSLPTGNYRVIAKGLAEDASGAFMLKLDCRGEGCAEGPQCLVGDTFNALRGVQAGALVDHGKTVLTAASELTETTKAQIIAAVRESSHDDVTTIEGAFEAVDQNEVNRFRFDDELAGRSLIAIEYGAGDNSYGAIFVEDSATVVAGIHDGEIAECAIAPQACVFGPSLGDAAYMPNLKRTGAQELASTAGVEPVLASQIAAANAGDGTLHVEHLKHSDGRKFTSIHGDAGAGAIFPADSATPVARIADGELSACTAF